MNVFKDFTTDVVLVAGNGFSLKHVYCGQFLPSSFRIERHERGFVKGIEGETLKSITHTYFKRVGFTNVYVEPRNYDERIFPSS